jgi:hypothetical protein
MKRTHNKRNSNHANIFGMGMELFWDRIGDEAVKHVGRGDQIKGTIHEMAHCTLKNIQSAAKVTGEVCHLTKQKNAPVVDAVIMRNGKTIGREQLKDVTSRSGIRSVVRRIQSGYYRSAKLVATRESAKMLSGKTKKPIHSSGISSKTTQRAADNQGANVRDNSLLQNNLSDIGNHAKNAALFSMIFGATTQAVSRYKHYKSGEINRTDYAKSIITHAGKQGAKSATKTGAALLAKEGLKVFAKKTGQGALRRLAGSNAGTTIVFGLVEQAGDTIKLASGKINARTYKNNSVRNAGSTGGAQAGTAIGASNGSAVPNNGTAIGAAVGGVIGSLGGSFGAKKLTSITQDAQPNQKQQKRTRHNPQAKHFFRFMVA